VTDTDVTQIVDTEGNLVTIPDSGDLTDVFALHIAAVDPHSVYETTTEVAAKIATHSAAADPHSVYETSAEAAAKVTAHEAAADPHTGYQRETEKGAANGYASLSSGILVPIAQLPVGTGASQVAAGNHAHAASSAGFSMLRLIQGGCDPNAGEGTSDTIDLAALSGGLAGALAAPFPVPFPGRCLGFRFAGGAGRTYEASLYAADSIAAKTATRVAARATFSTDTNWQTYAWDGGDVDVVPGMYWLTIRNTTAGSLGPMYGSGGSFGPGSQFNINRRHTALPALGATLDLSASNGWTGNAAALYHALMFRVFGDGVI
jgi:hypothetical protein